MTEPIHLKNISKGELWRMWQDSELELRQRLQMVEDERNILASELSQKYKTFSKPANPVKEICRRQNYEDGLLSEAAPSTCLDLELEVPLEFRDTTSKDLKKNRHTRSLEEGRKNRSSTRESEFHSNFDNSHRDHNELRSQIHAEREYKEFCQSVRSLEDNLSRDNEERSEIRRAPHQQRTSKSKFVKKREPANPRRCKSSLDSRRSRSSARDSQSESSDSPRIERVPIQTVDPREGHYSSREYYKKKSSSPMGDYSDRSSVGREYRRRRHKVHKSEKTPFASLPRNKPQYRRKTSNTLSYCSKSSSSDADELPYNHRQYNESSPLPLLQSLQRHSLGKQRNQNPKPKPKTSETIYSEFKQGRKNLRRVSPYADRIPYINRIPREGSCPTHGSYHGNHHGIIHKGHGRSNLDIRDLSLGELY